MKRILIIGPAGAGKSTLARELKKHLRIPLINLDQLYWHPNWVRPKDDEWKNKVQKLIQKNEWILDGMYQSTLDLRIPRADTIIFMDVPRLICLWRVLKRRIKKTQVAPGCIEKLDLEFIMYIWNFPKRKRPGILKSLKKWKNKKKIHIINSEKEMWKFLKDIKTKNQL
ncbi:AAA family ATPase [bacterium]|nr:AAA family ATPase [bacterium]|tara:strand:+ start:2039 stop:2545 length:507 start_codon:yes stop_codon:yes gene_type:complete